MTNQIRTYKELLEEKERLKLLLRTQKDVLRQDVNQIKLELAPVRKAVTTVGKMFTKDKTSIALSTAADTVIDIFIRRMVLSKAGWFTKIVVPFFMKNVSSHVIADNKDKILSKLSALSGFFSKKTRNGKMSKKERKEMLAEEQED
ncbi:MAG: hypothetical protein EOO10_23650 [Chitinophagaceae bacterium]|nr:MAG: hypothetical protein EOO10_23650 [Chitinophagaceae bacterium]